MQSGNAIQNADIKGKILKDQLEKAKTAKKQFNDIGEKICKYAYDPDHNFQYDKLPPDTFFRAKVAKTAEYMEVVGPALYQNNPDRRVNPRRWATEQAKQRGMVMQDWLNYTPIEGDLSGHSRRAINEALSYGAGVMWTGLNTRKNITQSVYDTIENLLCDPAAGMWEEMSWVARLREKPRWQMLDMFPDHKKEIMSSCNGNDPTSKVKYAVMYLRVGIHHFSDGKALNTDDNGVAINDDTPKKYTVLDNGALIEEATWEIPYYLDDAWPCELLGFRERPKQVWPVSPLEPGLGFQEAINYVTTFWMAKLKTASRDILGVHSSVTEEDLTRVLRGIGLQYLPVDGSQGNGDIVDLHKMFQQWSFDPKANDFINILGVLERGFEKATGLTDFISTGTTDRQFRSAAEAEMKDRNAKTRFDDMRIRVEKWQSNIARREAQAARFLLTGTDIGKVLGPQAAQVWGELMPPMDIQRAQLEQDAMERGMSPQDALPYIEQNVQQDGVVYEEWMLECDYNIEAGSTRRKDISQQIDAANEFVKQVIPPLVQAGQVPTALRGLAAWAKINGMPAELEQAINDATQNAQQQQQIQQQIAQQQAMMPPPGAGGPPMPPGQPPIPPNP